MKRRIKINAIAIALSIFLIAKFHDAIIRHSNSFGDDFMEIVGINLIFLGQLLRVSARGYKAEHSKGGNQLIQDGPYALVRNPMYLGIILIGLGVVLYVCNAWVFVLFSLVFISRYLYLFVREEKILLQAFGGQFLAYQKKVPRLLPRISLMVKGGVSKYLPLRMSWFRPEAMSIALVLLLVMVVELSEELAQEGLKKLAQDACLFLFISSLYCILILFLVRRYENRAA